MAQDSRIVIELLEKHSRVPTKEEILERYVRLYKGRRLGVAAQQEGYEAPKPTIGFEAVEEESGRQATMVMGALTESEIAAKEVGLQPVRDEGVAGTDEGSQVSRETIAMEAIGEVEGNAWKRPQPEEEEYESRETVSIEAIRGEAKAYESPGSEREQDWTRETLSMEAVSLPEAEDVGDESRSSTLVMGAVEEGPDEEQAEEAGSEDEEHDPEPQTAKPSGRPGKKKKKKKRRGLGA